MSAALLVIGYKEPECLKYALPIYTAANFEVFVHVDAKGDLDRYKQALGALANLCTFVTPRQTVFWAGFNMVRAEMTLLEHALKSPRQHNKFVLVSDDTFPVMGSDRLRTFLDDDLDRMALRRLEDGEEFTKRYDRFFFLDHPAMSLHGRPIESSYVDDELRAAFADMERVRLVGKKKLKLFYGSQWWALGRSTAAAVLRCYQEDYHLVSSFRFSAVPDEMFVQTVVATEVGLHRARPTCTCVDWSRNPRPYVFNDVGDIRSRLNRDHAFIRKVSSRDPEFLKRLLAAVAADELAVHEHT